MERLNSEQEEYIEYLIQEHGVGVMTSSRNTTAVIKELADKGFLLDFNPFLDGTCNFVIGGDCLAYLEEKKRLEEDAEEARKHDWRLTHANGVYAIVGAIIGFLLGKFF